MFTSILRKLCIPFFITAVLLVMLQTAVPQTAVAVATSQNNLETVTQSELTQPTQPLTNSITLTYTESFDSYSCLGEKDATVDWNIFDQQVTLNQMSNATSQVNQSIVVDEEGNTYFVWEDYRNGSNDPDIYAQKVDVNSRRLWATDIRVNSDQRRAFQGEPEIIQDHSGNLIVVWLDGLDDDYETIYAQKLNPDGQKLWAADQEISTDIVLDDYPHFSVSIVPGTGQFVVTWDDDRNGGTRVYAQWLNTEGDSIWEEDLLVTDEFGYDPSVSVADGSAYIVWDSGAIYAQKFALDSIFPTGLWSSDVLVSQDYSSQNNPGSPEIVTDSNGTSYVLWERGSGLSASLYLQKITVSGTLAEEWPEEPIRVASTDASNNNPGFENRSNNLILDNQNHIFVPYFREHVWGYAPALYIKKFSSIDGSTIWPATLIHDSSIPISYRGRPSIGMNDNDDIHVAWADYRNGAADILFQGFDQDRNKTWAKDQKATNDVGTLVTSPQIAVGANNDVRLIYLDGNETYAYPNIHLQGIDTLGHVLLPPDSQVNLEDPEIKTKDWEWASSPLAVHPDGSSTILWVDKSRQLFMQTMEPDGSLTSPIIVATYSGGDSTRHSLTIDSEGNQYVVWESFERDPDGEIADILLQKFVDGESQFDHPKRVHVDSTITNTQLFPAIQYDGLTDTLFAIWYDEREDVGKFYAQRLALDGTPMWGADVAASARSIFIHSFYNAMPEVAIANGHAYLFLPSGADRVYLQRIDPDGTLLWGEEGREIVVERYTQFAAAARTHNGVDYVYLAHIQLNEGDYDVLLRQLNPTDGSDVWSTYTGSAPNDGWLDQEDVDIDVDSNGDVYLVWRDNRAGNPGIYVSKVSRDGAKVWPYDSRIDHKRYFDDGDVKSCDIIETDENITWVTLHAEHDAPAGTALAYYVLTDKDVIRAFPGQPIRLGEGCESEVDSLSWRALMKSNEDQTAVPSIHSVTIEYTTGCLPSRSVRVFDEFNNLVPDAEVYRNGQFVGLTDQDGALILRDLDAGDTLTALVARHEEPSHRENHTSDGVSNYAYRVYETSFPIEANGYVASYVVQNPNQIHSLYVDPNNPLVLFNLVVSVEWNASQAYLEEIERAMKLASDYLYDFTDGQMAFGQVTIYNNREHWKHADIQIMAKNSVRPHAYIGGLLSDEPHHVIRLGRQWDGLSGNSGPWDHPHGYRTIAHEFGHYALFLYDEYFGYEFNAQNIPIRRVQTNCTGVENQNGATDATNASVMDYHYTSSELSHRFVDSLWSLTCEQTAQFQLNYGESAWETWVRIYADEAAVPKWVFTTPQDRGMVLAGPDELSDNILNVPIINVTGGSTISPKELSVVDLDAEPVQNVLVVLYKSGGRQIIYQGLTDANGRLTIYGAEKGDTLRGITLDGSLAGIVHVEEMDSLVMTLNPIGGRAARADDQFSQRPHSTIHAIRGADPEQIELLIHLTGFDPLDAPVLIVAKPDSEVNLAPLVRPDSEAGSYNAQLSFSSLEQGTGHVQIIESTMKTQVDYRLQLVHNNQAEDVFSNDGQLHLQVFTDSLPAVSNYFVVASPLSIPTPTPEEKVLMGSAYDITAEGIATLEKDAVLMLSYEGEGFEDNVVLDDISIYRWHANLAVWEPIASVLDVEHKTVSAPIQNLGLYALFAVPNTENSSYASYLPLIRR